MYKFSLFFKYLHKIFFHGFEKILFLPDTFSNIVYI